MAAVCGVSGKSEGTKRCRACGLDKPTSSFNKNKTKSGGLSGECRECSAELTRRWREANPERVRLSKKAARQATKRTVIDAYGGACACCGETELAFLTIGHVNNDGAAHRRRLGKSKAGGYAFYCYLIANNFPNDPPLETQCWQCNGGAKCNGGVCPHKTRGFTNGPS